MARPRRDSTLAPSIDAVLLPELAPGTPDQLVGDADLHALAFTDLDVPVLSLGGASVDGCGFAGITAREGDWRATRLRESTFERLDLPVVRAARGVWRDVHLAGARLGSVEAYESQWQSVHFVGCKLGFLNLRSAELLDVAFTDCVIEELDLLQTTARRVAFRNTRLTRLNAHEAKLEHVDLRGAELEQLDGLGGLRGATISPHQLDLLAPLLAREKGIKVEDA